MPATPTPPIPTTQGNGVRMGGRTAIALRELKRRLETELPPFIDAENQRLGLSGPEAFQKFKSVGIAPADLTKNHINQLLLRLRFRFMPQGSVAHKRVGTLQIFIVEARWERDEQIFDGFDRSEMVMKVLANYPTGVRDPQEHWCWRELNPISQTDLADHYPDYAGACLEYDISQMSGDDLWAT